MVKVDFGVGPLLLEFCLCWWIIALVMVMSWSGDGSWTTF